MKRTLLLVSMVAACGKHSPAPVANHGSSGPAASQGERAFVIDAGKLVEVSATGNRVVTEGVESCSVDPKARVVWLVDGSGVSALDLVDGKVHPIIDHDLAVRTPDGVEHTRLEWIVDWGKERLGGESLLDFDVGVAVKMTSKPTLEMVEGCDGDRAVYCQDENGNPTQTVVDAQKLAKSLRLVDPAYVATLAARGANTPLWTTPPVPQAPKAPAVDRSHCEENPDDCGALTPVPGTPLWLVGTENSRGDYFHLTRELWDPATNEFIRVTAGTLHRTAQPPYDSDGIDYGGMRVSPSGMMSLHGIVFDAHHVLYAPHESGETCGFTSGYRIQGPTDG